MLGPVRMEPNFESELAHLLNRYSQENASNTPDWILAQYLLGCLTAWEAAIQQREEWYGRPTSNILAATAMEEEDSVD